MTALGRLRHRRHQLAKAPLQQMPRHLLYQLAPWHLLHQLVEPLWRSLLHQLMKPLWRSLLHQLVEPLWCHMWHLLHSRGILVV